MKLPTLFKKKSVDTIESNDSMDVAPRRPPYHGSSYKNTDTGQGTHRDHRNAGYFAERVIGFNELEHMYEHNGLAGLIIDLPVDDMLKNWRDFDDSYKDQIKQAEKAANYKHIIKEWIKTSDIYGGAVLIPLIYGQDNLEQPLNINRIRKGDVFRWLILDPITCQKHVANYWDITRDNFMKPDYYILPTENGSINIHPSRVFERSGIKRPMRKRLIGNFFMWGLSRLARCYDSIQTYEEVMGSTAQLVTSANVDVLTEEGLSDALTTEAEDSLMHRASIMNRLKSVFGLLVIDKEAQYSRNTVSFGGLAPTLEIAQEDVSKDAGIPVTYLFGKAKAGMSGDTNDGDIRNYIGRLENRQEELETDLKEPDEIMIRNALGSMPNNLSFTWNPIAVVTGAEAAKIESDLANAAKARIESGQLAPEEVHAALESTPYYKLDDAAFKRASMQREKDNAKQDQKNTDNV